MIANVMSCSGFICSTTSTTNNDIFNKQILHKKSLKMKIKFSLKNTGKFLQLCFQFYFSFSMKICLYVYIFLLSFVYNKLISHNLYMFLDSLHLPNVTLCYILCTNHKLKSEKKKLMQDFVWLQFFIFFLFVISFYVVNDLLKIILLTFFISFFYI